MESTTILGIPVPSTDPLFLALVAAHIGFGLCAVASGIAAMLIGKGRGRHSRTGKLYFWSLSGVALTMSALSYLRWAEDYPLFFLGLASIGVALLGRWAVRNGMLRLHLTSMGMSYVVMLTAFYVDNGKALPLWRELPQIAFWIIPTAIGAPIIVYYFLHPPRRVDA